LAFGEAGAVSEAFQSTSLSLLARARSDDQEAWGQLVHLYGPLVHRWCKRSGLTDEDAADVFQETFQSVSTHLDSFAPSRAVGSFRAWLRSIVRRKIVDQFRRQKHQPRAQGGSVAQMQLADIEDPFTPDADETPDQAVEENALVVQRAMELIRPQFSEQNWDAFQQVALHGKDAGEVAAALGINVQAVRQANYRIRRRLRLVLQDLAD
jgi:RNA polymerase sigma-70 factor (ECF subfamily)